MLDDTRTLHDLTRALDADAVDRIAAAMVASMDGAVEELAIAPEFRQEVLSASRATGRAFLDSVDRVDYVSPAIPPALADLALTLARRGYEPTLLMKLARIGQSVYWPALMESAEQRISDAATRLRVLNLMYERFSQYMEDSLDGAVAVYQRERDRYVRGRHARRAETIRAIIDGDELDLEAAIRRLGHNLRLWQTGFALWDESAAADVDDRLEGHARGLAAAIDAGPTLFTPSGSRGLWLWVGTLAPLSAALRARASAVTPPQGVRAAAGLPAPGLDGFRRSHEEALDAQRIAIEGEPSATMIWYGDVELESLLFHNQRGLRALVARELGSLSGRDATAEKLRGTVLTYLRCGSSATAAARELGAHKNTVRYRVEQAEARLGRPLARQELRLQLALMAVDTLGDQVLPDTR